MVILFKSSTIDTLKNYHASHLAKTNDKRHIYYEMKEAQLNGKIYAEEDNTPYEDKSLSQISKERSMCRSYTTAKPKNYFK